MATPYPRAVAMFPTVRQSVLAGFADCGLSTGYNLRVAVNHPSDRAVFRSGHTTHRASAGRLAHSTLARAVAHMVSQGEERIDPDTVVGFYEDELRQANVPLAETFSIPPHEDRFLRRTLRKWARENTITIADVRGIERRLEATITYPDGEGGEVERVITGQLDLLLLDPTQRHATVPDYKHTWKLPPERHDHDADEDDGLDDGLSPEGFFQQWLYAVLVLVNIPTVQSVTLREFYLPRSTPREATIWRHELPERLSYFSALVERFDRSVQAAYEPAPGRRRRIKPLTTPEQWGEPSSGSHCSYCPLAHECPAPARWADGGVPTTLEEAEQAMAAYYVARRVMKRAWSGVAVWTDRNGPIRVRDAKAVRLVGHVVSTRTERPSRRQVEQAVLAGRDPLTLFRTKTYTRLADYAPEQDVGEVDDDDNIAMFEAAAAAAAERNRRRRR